MAAAKNLVERLLTSQGTKCILSIWVGLVRARHNSISAIPVSTYKLNGPSTTDKSTGEIKQSFRFGIISYYNNSYSRIHCLQAGVFDAGKVERAVERLR